MKKTSVKLFLYASVVLVAALSSCSRDIEPETVISDSDMTIVAGFGATKTVNEGMSTSWAAGDELSVFCQIKGQSAYSANNFKYVSDNSFKGHVKKTGKVNSWYAVYPYKSGNESPSAVALSVQAAPEQQGEGSTAHLAGENFPLFGKCVDAAFSPSLEIGMGNALAVAKFNVTNTLDVPVTLTSVEFTSTSPVAGDFVVDVTADTPVWTAQEGAGNTVTLNVAGQAVIAAGETGYFYAGVVPHTVPNDSSLVFKVNAKREGASEIPCYVKKTVAISLVAGVIQPFTLNYDEDHRTPEPQPEQKDVFKKVTAAPATWDGTYLIVDESASQAFAFDAGSYKTAVKITDGEIAYSEELAKYAVTVTGAGVTHKSLDAPAYDLTTSTGKYIYCSSSEIKIADSHTKSSYTYYHCLSYSNGGVQLVSSRNSSGSTAYYMAYSSGAFGYSSSSSSRVQIYQLTKSGPAAKEDQTLSFASPAQTWTLGDSYKVGSSYDPQAVEGAKTDVTWVSSNPSVATVDGSKLKIVAAGITIVTANAESSSKYNAGTASYTLTIEEAPAGFKGYTLLTSEPKDWSGSYIFVNPDKSSVFTGAVDSHAATCAALSSSDFQDGVIMKEFASCEFTISKDGSDYFLKHDGKYMYCTEKYSSSNNTGIGFKADSTAFSFTSFDEGTFSFYVYDSKNKKDQYLYYKSDSPSYFKLGGSHNNIGILIYKLNGKSSAKQSQTLSFASESSTVTIGSSYETGKSYNLPQTVSGAKTAVTYSSSNKDVATVSGTKFTIVGTGSTIITAEAVATGTYYAGSASYTLNITKENAVNLENSYLSDYLDEAELKYTDDNWTSVTVVSDYKYTKISRKDVPNPVTISLGSGSSSKTVTVYSDAAMSKSVATATSTSSSVDIYNLVPGRTYYYSVTGGATGNFYTEGRRRLIRVSTTASTERANNCRDFGGLKTTDGKTLRYEMLYRGTSLDSTTDDEKTILTSTLGIKTDIDLRSEGSNKWNTKWGISYCKTGYNSFSETAADGLRKKSNIKKTFTDIISSVTEGKPCYIHCAIGADRTGYICLLIEAVLGVSPKDCSIDYELSTLSCAGLKYRDGSGEEYYWVDGMNYILGQTGTTFKDKAEKILTDAGITSKQISDFRNAMLQ